MIGDRRCVLFVAMSLDGFIAEKDGSVAWLDEFQGKGEDYGYAQFLDTVDTLVMGRTTYEQVLTFGDWPYAGKRSIVFSHAPLERKDGIEFTSRDVSLVMQSLRMQQGKDIWLVGGAKLVRSFLKAGQIDVMIVSIMPRLLGQGIPLFLDEHPSAELELKRMERYGNVMQLEYRTVL